MSFPVIAVAASAGGLEPLLELLEAIPENCGMAFIVVQHLDPDRESLLPQILSKKTSMSVLSAEQGLKIAPNHVYVIPPNVRLTLEHDTLQLTPREKHGRHMPADALFKSLAQMRGDSAIGVILSGGDSDGAAGLQALKNSGGITFAQEPASARSPSMPRSAIETGCVDFVLTPQQIGQELLRLSSHPYLRALEPSPTPAEESAEDDEESLLRIFKRLRSAHGVDFRHYKPSTLHRRLARRMALLKIEHLRDYNVLIENDADEAAVLYQVLLPVEN